MISAMLRICCTSRALVFSAPLKVPSARRASRASCSVRLRASSPASMPAAVRSKERLKVAKRTMGVGVSESFWLLQPAINPREMAAASRDLLIFFIVIFRSINRLCLRVKETQAGPL
ncbi:hypothetical protein D3C86_1718980 [compost metagenome]